ncbi:hypothetical protein FN846DRAFT_894183 [Sphaerosporella brunnea]|uniref:Uncharacterized protein n=1 Tax=Sphaerosporella brunnea TaxID=1250544 RepID=A0A5J5EJM4_9PEZI|nr:hypothetical protein FN846DRAFT_894183 [Sphaerosporella brunnea]
MLSNCIDVIPKKRNCRLKQSSSVVLLLKCRLNHKTVDDWELCGLEDQPAQPEDPAASTRDALTPSQDARQALGYGIETQEEEDFDWGSDLSDITENLTVFDILLVCRLAHREANGCSSFRSSFTGSTQLDEPPPSSW